MSSASEAEDKLSSDDGDEEEYPTLLTIPTVSSPSVPEDKLGNSNCDEESEELIGDGGGGGGGGEEEEEEEEGANSDDDNQDLAVCTIPDATSNVTVFEAGAHQSWPSHVSVSSALEAALRSQFADMSSSHKDMSIRDPITWPTPSDVTLDHLLAKLQQWDITPTQSAPTNSSTSNSGEYGGLQQEGSHSGPSQSKVTKPKGGRTGNGKGKTTETNNGDDPGPDDSKDSVEAPRFACPFAKRDPERYAGVDGPCTSGPGLEYKRVKAHLRNVHSMKKRCVFCKIQWTIPEFGPAFIDHLRRNECVNALEQRRKPEPMTAAQEQVLDTLCTRKDKMNNHTGWVVLFRELFPNFRPVPSPYYEFLWHDYDTRGWNTCDPCRDWQQQLTEIHTPTNAFAPHTIQAPVWDFPPREFGPMTYVQSQPIIGSGAFNRWDDPNPAAPLASVPGGQFTSPTLFTQDLVTESLLVVSTESNSHVRTRQIQNPMQQMASGSAPSTTQPSSIRRHNSPYGSAINSSVEGSDVSRMPTECPPEHQSALPAYLHMPNANVALLPPIINPATSHLNQPSRPTEMFRTPPDDGSNVQQLDATPFEPTITLDDMTALQTEGMSDERWDDWSSWFLTNESDGNQTNLFVDYIEDHGC